MPSVRLRDQTRTLRFRLTFWNTAIVLLIVIVALWGVRTALYWTLLQESESQLREDLLEMRLTFEQLWPDLDQIHAELERKAITHTHRGLYVRLYDGDVEVWTSSNAPNKIFPVPRVPTPRPVYYRNFLLIHAQTERPGVPKWTLRAGCSLLPIQTEVTRITRLMLPIGALILLISPLGGYILAFRATKPLADMIDQTARLHPDKLDERLPDRGTGDELDRLALTINGFLDRIAAYLQQHREFTANAAHELRSPLAAIQNTLEVTLHSERTVGEYRESLGEVLDQCEGLRLLVNQLLLLAETDIGQAAPALTGSPPCELTHVVQRSLDMFTGVAESRGIELSSELQSELYVPPDGGRLAQVVNNLLDNALKFTEPGGRVDVTLKADAPTKGVSLIVTDTGCGIPADDLPRLCERFFRGDKSRAREGTPKGSGLGLSIVRGIVTTLGGQLEFDSRPGQGTTVRVTLPRHVATPPDAVA